jgi:hypothetical protein
MTPTITDRPRPPRGHLRRPGETFDLNTARVAGVILKLWPRNGDVFARLRISTHGHPAEVEDPPAAYCNLRFPEGKANNQPISLQTGDAIRATGYLTHNEYFETIHRFLQDARTPTFLKAVPPEDLNTWQAVTFRRVNMMLNVRGLVCPGPDGTAGQGFQLAETEDAASLKDPTVVNQVALEGIVARSWEYADHRFVRLAVYDRFTPIARGNQIGKHGRPRRKPHYITIRFSEGKVAGRPITIRLKDRIRLTGAIGQQATRVTLHQALLETGNSEVVDLLSRLPNADQCQEIATLQESLHIDAGSLIAYTGRSERDS